MLEPGGTSWTLEHRDGVVMDGDKTEHVAEFVRVLGRYCAAIGVRTFAALKNWEEERTDPVLECFRQVFGSADHQSRIGDASSVSGDGRHDDHSRKARSRTQASRAHLGLASESLADGCANSFALAAAQMGHDLVVAHPEGYELDDELIGERSSSSRQQQGAAVEVTNDIDAALTAPKSFMPRAGARSSFMARRSRTLLIAREYREKWIVDEAKMAQTNNAIFMHCLPVRRNVIVTDGVIDSPRQL